MVSLVSLLLIATVTACGQIPETKLVEVTFEVSVPPGRSGTVFVSGDAPELGAWRASGVPLTLGADGKHRATVRLPPGTSILYKATRGDWSSEETTPDGSPVENRRFTAPADGVAVSVPFTVAAWRDETRRPVGLDTGRIKVHEKFRATKLGNERRLFVLLPASYAASPKRRYPVIYAHDGQNMFASVTGGARWDWNIDAVLDRLAASGDVPEAIVVGVPSTDIRIAEYDPLARGADYADFLIREVKPFVDRTYRTKADRANTTTIGSSMGGLISSYLVLRHSGVFSRAACLSIHVIHPMEDAAAGAWVRTLEAAIPEHRPVRLYVDRGTVGLDGKYGPLFDRLVALLERAGFVRGKSLDVLIAEGPAHNEAAWAARVDRPLRFLLGP